MSLPPSSIPPDKSPDRIAPDKALEPVDKPLTPGQAPAGFESYMQEQGRTPAAPQAPGGATPGGGIAPPGALGSPPIATGGVSFDTLLAQSKTTQDSLGTVEQQLNNQNLKLKRSQSHLVKQKLGDASGYIRSAGSKLGLDLPESKLPPGVSGISRFLAMVNDGQDQLVQVQARLKAMSANNEQLNPGEMMSIQVKMGLAQQEIEYTSTLLGKVVQSVTQILNVQL